MNFKTPLDEVRGAVEPSVRVAPAPPAEEVGSSSAGGDPATPTSGFDFAAFDADHESFERGLARVVLSLIELLRELMERQALRRIDAGSLGPEKVEQLGEAFILLEERMQELKDAFGLADEDLKLDFSVLGKLI